MKLSRPDLAAYALTALCVLVVAALVALGRAVPDLVSFVAVTALGAGAGVATQPKPATAADPATPPAEPAPAPVPLAAEPATGVMRIASHAP